MIKVTGEPKLEAIPEKITTIAQAVGLPEKGKTLVEQFNAELLAVPTSPINKSSLFNEPWRDTTDGCGAKNSSR